MRTAGGHNVDDLRQFLTQWYRGCHPNHPWLVKIICWISPRPIQWGRAAGGNGWGVVKLISEVKFLRRNYVDHSNWSKWKVSWVITAPSCLVDALIHISKGLVKSGLASTTPFVMVFLTLSNAKVSFSPCLCRWSLFLHTLPLSLREGLAFHYALPRCHGNIVPFQWSALTPWCCWADLSRVLLVLF